MAGDRIFRRVLGLLTWASGCHRNGRGCVVCNGTCEIESRRIAELVDEEVLQFERGRDGKDDLEGTLDPFIERDSKGPSVNVQVFVIV